MRLLLVDPVPRSRDWLVQRLRASGHRIVGMAPVEVGTAGPPVDVWVQTPLHPVIAAVRAARELHRAHRFDGVLCFHQAATFAANHIAHDLGCPPLWDDPDADLRSKAVTARMWEAAGLAFPRVLQVEAIGDEDVVVKPEAMQGGIGVRWCVGGADARRWARDLSTLRVPIVGPGGADREMSEVYGLPAGVVAQEAVPTTDRTPEYTAEFAVVDGTPRLVGYSEKRRAPRPFMRTTTTLLPSPHLRPDSGLEFRLARFVTALGLRWGFAHVEFAMVDGVPRVFELNPRLIGEPIASFLEIAYGLGVPEAGAALACGREPVWPCSDTDVCVGDADVPALPHLYGQAFRGLDLAGMPPGLSYYVERLPRDVPITPRPHRGYPFVASAHYRTHDLDVLRQHEQFWNGVRIVVDEGSS